MAIGPRAQQSLSSAACRAGRTTSAACWSIAGARRSRCRRCKCRWYPRRGDTERAGLALQGVRGAAHLRRGDRFGFRREVFARVDESIALEPVLLVVKLPVPSALLQQFLVSPALHDFSLLEDQNLIGAANR